MDKKFNKETIKPKGTWHSTTAPDTLDLAWHAKLAVNYLTRSVDPNRGYLANPRLSFGRQAPTVMWQLQLIPTGITPFMNLRALPLMRTMCGDTEGLDIEVEMMRSHLLRIKENGLLNYPRGDAIIPMGTSYPNASGFTALAFANWHSRDGNPIWLNQIALLAAGLRNTAIKKNDYAYYPPESGVDEKGVWHSSPNTQRLLLTKPFVEYCPPSEPVVDQVGYLGNAKYAQAGPLMALLADYHLNGNQQSLIMARKIAHFCLKPQLWEDQEKGKWAGYFQGNMTVLQALLQFAITEKDDQIKEVVRRGYELGRQRGTPCVGWFPYWTPPRTNGYPEMLSTWCETCAVAGALILAIQLSDAGVGDYWDDVDRYIRNQLIEQQFVNLDLMQQVSSKGSPPIEIDKIQAAPADGTSLLERFLGGFGGGEVDSAGLIYMDKNSVIDNCCSSNGAIALYHAWHGITRYNNGVATVNLLLNRTSPWLDVDSYLPYEGRVVLHNKKAATVMVRIPGWIKMDEINCLIDGKTVNADRSDRCLVFRNMSKNVEIVLEFPVTESSNHYNIAGRNYSIAFRGHTAVSVEPKRKDPYILTLYERRHMKNGKSPISKKKKFIADQQIALF